jgi:hypothetical protein
MLRAYLGRNCRELVRRIKRGARLKEVFARPLSPAFAPRARASAETKGQEDSFAARGRWRISTENQGKLFGENGLTRARRIPRCRRGVDRNR